MDCSTGSGAGNMMVTRYLLGGPAPVAGCTDTDACNYNADATVDDGL